MKLASLPKLAGVPAKARYMISNKIARKVLVCCVGIVMTLGSLYAIMVATGRVTWRGACATETIITIPNLSGMEFEVTYTNCDTLAKEEAISVYVSTAAANRESLLSRWSNRKTILFRYDPGGSDIAPPSIKAAGKDRVLISIPEVSSVLLENRKWRNVSIDYEIGHIIS